MQIYSETNGTDEDDEDSEEGEELDLDGEDEDEDEDEDEENEPHETQLDNQTSTLDAPPLEVQLDEDMTPGGRVDENDEEENAEDEASEDAKKITKRAKKRVKEERSVPLCRFSGTSEIHSTL